MYDTFAPDYDHFVNWPQRLSFEMPFLLQLLGEGAQPSSQPLNILDAACGTGQHAIALAQAGYHVSAADLSTGMIEHARENARRSSQTIDFRVAGFGSLAQTFPPNSFDAVLCLGNSLPHVLSAADLAGALRDFRDCLRPDGMLLLQSRNFDAVMQTRNRWMEPQADSDGQHDWLFYRFYDFETNGLIRFNVVMLKRLCGGEWSTTTSSTFLMPQLEKELLPALQNAGFDRLQIFGSLAGESFDAAASANLVVQAFANSY